ncbi:MAG: bifunctional methylenetetrahydrofolate dehydrogenase/methenyltetrahydrofolate cyclohydrolase FolD [Alphaproteobacteria bacterium]|nr:bifunctional methylenetetrahydrofolate dehydrogenase/methenyltetrahydrofolate cyclohydrolase FolD [Alphaproteobacteria bacterium]
MVAKLIDGHVQALLLYREIAAQVENFKAAKGYTPGLAVVLVGDNPSSQIYVENKRKACAQVGITSQVHHLPKTASQEEIIRKINTLNADEAIHGILIQLPLPESIDGLSVISAVAPHKDVDGLHPLNLGLLFMGRPNLIPCTPLACRHLIKSVLPSLKGKCAVIVGRSFLVGRPLGVLLSFENATVVQAHSHTANLVEECRRADILVVAAGSPRLITKEHVKQGAVVIDVGITRGTDSKGSKHIMGDVDFEEVQEVASYLTPVPGGVGPMTIAYLLQNTLTAAQKS